MPHEMAGLLQTPTVPEAGQGGWRLDQAVAGQIHPGAHLMGEGGRAYAPG
jgi:hypothetical protein